MSSAPHFDRKMSDAEGLMWRLEKDPHLSSTFANITILDRRPDIDRLMRRMDDWGVVAILDGRLRSKGYGKWLAGGLPPAPMIGTLAEVEAFCRGPGVLR